MASLEAPAIGIDLGTTFSCVGVFKDGEVHIISNPENSKTTPSYVAFTENGRLVGSRAKKWALIDPQNTVNNIKRMIGRSMDDEAVKEEIRRSAFKILDDGKGKPCIQVEVEGETKRYPPEEISAMVLREMKSQAEDFLNMPVKDAVITVPAYFNDIQRQATHNAGRIAGLNVLGIINEPTAAALAYGFDNSENEDQRTILIYDFGGGTFDVSVLQIDNGNIEVLSTGGDGHKGGEDIDNLLLDHFCKEFTKKFGVDITERANLETTAGPKRDAYKALRRLRYACEKAKIELSSKHSAGIELDSLFEKHDLEGQLTRPYFEGLAEEFIRSTLATVAQVLGEANLAKNAVTDVILVGGTTRIPKLKMMLRDFFNQEASTVINPDEAVAFGAAIQAAILSGVDARRVRNIHLRDVTPLSLGIETFGGVMTTIIRRGTPVPVQRTKVFSTSKDNQTTICFQIYEGERVMTENNHLLAEFTLVGIPPAPRRIPQIQVEFSVDANGILKVSAMDLSTEWETGIQVTNDRGRLSAEEIQAAIEDAKRMMEQDLKLRTRVSAKEHLEVYMNKISATLKNMTLREKIDPETRTKILEKLNESQAYFEYLQETDHVDFERKRNELEELWTPVVTKLYKSDKNLAPPTLLQDSLLDSTYELVNP